MTKLEQMHKFAELVDEAYNYFILNICDTCTCEEDDKLLKDYNIDLSRVKSQYSTWRQRYKVDEALSLIYQAFNNASEPKSDLPIKIAHLEKELRVLKENRGEEELKS